jgi:hypothetical protein
LGVHILPGGDEVTIGVDSHRLEDIGAALDVDTKLEVTPKRTLPPNRILADEAAPNLFLCVPGELILLVLMAVGVRAGEEILRATLGASAVR